MEENFDEEEVYREDSYSHVPEEIMIFISTVFEHLQRLKLPPEESRLVKLALVNLDYHPTPPLGSFVVSFDYDDISYTLVYSKENIEVSDYVSADSGMGYDHYQQYKFYYDAGGFEEEEGGEIYELEENFLTALKRTHSSDISISEEE